MPEKKVVNSIKWLKSYYRKVQIGFWYKAHVIHLTLFQVYSHATPCSRLQPANYVDDPSRGQP